jgi:hypothetical protein
MGYTDEQRQAALKAASFEALHTGPFNWSGKEFNRPSAADMETALRDIIFGADMMLQIANGAFASYCKEVKRVAQAALTEAA